MGLRRAFAVAVFLAASALGIAYAQQSASKPLSITVNPATSGLAASPMFGMMVNRPSRGFPSVPFGQERWWDLGGEQWESVNTAAGSFNFTGIDSQLAALYSNNVHEAWYTLAGTPAWATSNNNPGGSGLALCPNDNVPVGSHGTCYPPSDLNADGTGTDLIWRNWTAALASHANNATLLTNHAHIRYWEPWNEVDNSCTLSKVLTQPSCGANFWEGTYDQLQRMTEDLRCIVVGGAQTITATGETCAQVRAAVTSVSLSGPIDATAVIVLSSSHAQTSGGSLDVTQNELYCNHSPKAGSSCTGGGVHAAIDATNTHMKPGNFPSSTIEAETVLEINNFKALLQTAEASKPFYNGESGYSGSGWPSTGNYANVNNQESFIPRYFLVSWSNGVSSINWYTWDTSNTMLGSGPLIQGWTTTYNWMVGSVTTGPCSSSGTTWTCGLSANGVGELVVWDNSQYCSGSTCPTVNYTASSSYGHYVDIMGTVHTIPTNHIVPIGIRPVLLQP